MANWWKKSWYLVVIVVNLLVTVIIMAMADMSDPQIPRHTLLAEVGGLIWPVFIVTCGIGCLIGKILGANGLSKALFGLLFSWMLAVPVTTSVIFANFGMNVALVSGLMFPLVLVVIMWVFRGKLRRSDAGMNS